MPARKTTKKKSLVQIINDIEELAVLEEEVDATRRTSDVMDCEDPDKLNKNCLKAKRLYLE